IVLGELYYGALKSSRAKENLERIADLVASADILDCDSRTARLFGEVKDRLRQKGRPIPENDIWIAAMALQYDLTLVSRDAHFSEVEKLKLESW
ncbi:MAG: type II toxin-antitoxin system VapC family toxin, partial [Chloroflexota bacterium]